MRLTKFGHAGVRIEHAGGVLVLDPGVFTQREAVEGATAVLITHEHADHYLIDHLKATDAPVFTIAAVAAQIAQDAPEVAERTTTVMPGQVFGAGGAEIAAVGEHHAVIHPEWPVPDNSGFVFTLDGTTIYHPGDALTAPGVDVGLLLAPASAPWARSSELIDFIRAVKAPLNVAIHDRIYSEAGSGLFDMQAGAFLPAAGQEWKRLKDGEDL